MSYSQTANTTEPIRLAFEDGSSAECDVLVGADGLKSAVRGSMMEELASATESEGRIAEASELRDKVRAKFSGLVSYRTIIPSEKLRAISPNHNTLTLPVQVLNTFLSVFLPTRVDHKSSTSEGIKCESYPFAL